MTVNILNSRAQLGAREYVIASQLLRVERKCSGVLRQELCSIVVVTFLAKVCVHRVALIKVEEYLLFQLKLAYLRHNCLCFWRFHWYFSCKHCPLTLSICSCICHIMRSAGPWAIAYQSPSSLYIFCLQMLTNLSHISISTSKTSLLLSL